MVISIQNEKEFKKIPQCNFTSLQDMIHVKNAQKKVLLRCPPHKNSVYATNSVVPRSEILRAMFAPLPIFWGGHLKFLRAIYYHQ